ncbi:MAG: glycosyltransferase family 4 protein [Betaproteobacteria bacterium]
MTEPEHGALQGGAVTWMITRKYPSSPGGMQRLSFELTTRLGARRAIRLVALRRGETLAMFLLKSAAVVLGGIMRGSIRVLHLGDPVLSPIGAMAKVCGVPVCVTVHGLDVTHRSPVYRAWLRIFFRDLDAYLCISNATGEAAIARGAPPSRVHVTGIGIEAPPDLEPRSHETQLLLFVGRLVRRKGLAWFVGTVLPLLAPHHPALRLAIIGAGSERDAIERAAAKAMVADRLEWLGAVPEIEKWQWLARASICIMPNIPVDGDMEGYGITALEALAAGTPLVAADIEGLRDAVEPGVGAMLVPAQDARAWATALSGLLDSPEHAAMMGRCGREWARTHRRWDEVCDQYERVFDAVACRKSP